MFTERRDFQIVSNVWGEHGVLHRGDPLAHDSSSFVTRDPDQPVFPPFIWGPPHLDYPWTLQQVLLGPVTVATSSTKISDPPAIDPTPAYNITWTNQLLLDGVDPIWTQSNHYIFRPSDDAVGIPTRQQQDAAVFSPLNPAITIGPRQLVHAVQGLVTPNPPTDYQLVAGIGIPFMTIGYSV